MTDRWQAYVREGMERAGGPVSAAYEAWRYMAPVMERIRRLLDPGSRILELGCGGGFHACLLASWGFDVTGIDNDPRIVEEARRTSTSLGQSANFLVGDALGLPEALGDFDLVYSLGLVEHFDRHKTVAMLSSQATMGRFVVVVIPTKHSHHAAPITDERIYSTAELRGLVVEAGMSIHEAFCFGDLPTNSARIIRHLMPPAVYKELQRRTDYGMNLCVIGRARRRR